MSKQDQALVQAQLDKESVIRAKVNQVKARLERGLNLVHSLATARVELHAHISSIIGVLLEGAFGPNAVALIGFTAFERYLVSVLSPHK